MVLPSYSTLVRAGDPHEGDEPVSARPSPVTPSVPRSVGPVTCRWQGRYTHGTGQEAPRGSGEPHLGHWGPLVTVAGNEPRGSMENGDRVVG